MLCVSAASKFEKLITLIKQAAKVTFETTTEAKVASICRMYVFLVDFFCYGNALNDCMTDIGFPISTLLKQFLSLHNV